VLAALATALASSPVVGCGLGPALAHADAKPRSDDRVRGSCLRGAFISSDNKAGFSSDLVNEVRVERAAQRANDPKLAGIMPGISRAANVLCDALTLSDAQQPEILFVDREWSTLPRTSVGATREIVMLNADHAAKCALDDPSQYMLFAIMAHEFAHVFQFAQKFDAGRPRYIELSDADRDVRKVELHADFLAGYCLARTEDVYRTASAHELKRFSDTIFAVGDYEFRSDQHHGTKSERYTAMMRGYVDAKASGSAGDVLAFAERGVEIVTELPRCARVS
jgi:hypothetical protein